MRRFIKYIVVSITALFSSCDFDHLHYETSLTALIHIEIDWETLSHISPNGVSTYIFDSNGDRYSQVQLSDDPNNVYLKLPEGEYTVVFHNNSISELEGVELVGVDCLSTFSIHATKASYDSDFDTLDEEIFVDQPSDVVSYTLHNLKVSSSDVEYHYDKPILADYQQQVSQTYQIQPDHIVHVTRVIAYFDGEQYSSSKNPRAVIHGMSGGYYFGAECTSEEDVMEEFEVNYSSTVFSLSTTETSKVSGAVSLLDPDDEDGYSEQETYGMGMAYVDFNTFGMHITDPESQTYNLYMRFYLRDGTYTDYEVDITDNIKSEDTGTNNLHSVELILSPLPDGGGEPGDGTWGLDAEDDSSSGGTFEPSTDEWIDVGTDLFM